MNKYSCDFINPGVAVIRHNLFGKDLGIFTQNRIPGHTDFGTWGFKPNDTYPIGVELAKFIAINLHVLNSNCIDGFSEESFKRNSFILKIEKNQSKPEYALAVPENELSLKKTERRKK